jgi:hypothetical protein
MSSERELLVDCLERLNRVGVPYMLVGSMASDYWGIPRSTHDLDFVLVLGTSDVDALVAAFQDGFFLQPESIRNAFSAPYQFNAIDEQSALKIDFWLLQDDTFERTAFERRPARDAVWHTRVDSHGRGCDPSQVLLAHEISVGAATVGRRGRFRGASRCPRHVLSATLGCGPPRGTRVE